MRTKIHWLIYKDLLSECRSRQVWPETLHLGILVAVLFGLQINLPGEQQRRVSREDLNLTSTMRSSLGSILGVWALGLSMVMTFWETIPGGHGKEADYCLNTRRSRRGLSGGLSGGLS